MADVLTPAQRSFNMSRIRARGNASTEIAFAYALRVSRVSGWRRHAALPGRPDFVFRAARVAVFVHGCFWHGCSGCYRAPSSNRSYWKTKVAANRARDARTQRELEATGWRVVVVWEHDLATNARAGRAVRRVTVALSKGEPAHRRASTQNIVRRAREHEEIRQRRTRSADVSQAARGDPLRGRRRLEGDRPAPVDV